jgi:putative phosphonate catabolism associated alcohol dehydrogenase
MATSKIAVFETPEHPIKILTIDIPQLKDSEILVRNEYATLCRSDILTYTGKRKEKSPTILGHEIIGRIAAFGPASVQSDLRGNAIEEGDRITWAIFASDPSSEMAKNGMPQKAADLFKYGHEQITADINLHGGLSEYTVLRKFTPIIKLDEKINLPVAAIINCAVATVAGAFRLAGNINNKNILICGTGMLGIIACAMAKSKNATIIYAIDTNNERLTIAKEFGAVKCLQIDPGQNDIAKKFEENLNEKPEVHFVMDFSGSPDAMENCFDLLAIGGAAILIGATFPQRKVQLDAEKIVRKILTIKGLHNYNEQDLLSAVSFIETYGTSFPFEKLIFDGFQLDTANEAFQQAVQQNNFRVGIKL